MLATLLSLAFGAPPTIDLYVSPSGKDTNTGTARRPLQTPAAALRAVTDLRAKERRSGATAGPIRVHLRAGTYYLHETLQLDESVSGEVNAPTIIEGEGARTILSGGIPLVAQPHRAGPLQMTVPGTFAVNQVFLGDLRLRRPVFPEGGYNHIAAVPLQPVRETKGENQFEYKAGEIDPNWKHLGNAEILIFHKWIMTRIPIASVDAEHRMVTMAGSTQPASWAWLSPGDRYQIENLGDAPKRPGQFTFDPTSRTLTVLPPKQVAEKAPFVIPVLETVLRVAPRAEGLVHDLEVRNLEVRHSAWNMPATGRNFPQAEIDLGGAVVVQNARRVRFDHCAISETGGYGLEIKNGAQQVAFVNGAITNLGAGGVKLGETGYQADETNIARENTIKSCLIAGGGRVHPAAVGVWIGQSPHNVIQGNEITDFYYTGVSVGWTWGYGPSNSHHNLIVDNHIHAIGQGILSDMGGIYHLGVAPGTVLSGNVIHDVTSFDYGGWGLYTDEGSSGVLLERNLVYDCSRESFHQHYGKDNVVRHNIFAFAHEAQLARTRNEDHLSFTFDDNIVYYQGGDMLWGNWQGPGIAMDHNLYWRTDGKPVSFNGFSADQWKALGRDQHSVYADPLFVDPKARDFRLRPGSPALALGFQPMDPAARPPKSAWKQPDPAFPTIP